MLELLALDCCFHITYLAAVAASEEATRCPVLAPPLLARTNAHTHPHTALETLFLLFKLLVVLRCLFEKARLSAAALSLLWVGEERERGVDLSRGQGPRQRQRDPPLQQLL